MPATLPSPPPWTNKATGLLLAISTMTAVALLFVVGRIYSRLISIRKLLIGDYLVVFSIILAMLCVVLAGVGTHYGGGQHAADLDPEDLRKSKYFTVISLAPGALSFTFPKFAVVMLLVRILDPGKNHRRVMWVVSVVYGLFVISIVVINFAQCQPAAKQWGGAEGTCWPRNIMVIYGIAVSVASAMFDFYLAIYPTIVLCRLQINWKKKLGLSSALGFGYCAGIITIYKCTILHKLGEIDLTYSLTDVVLWTNIEGNAVLIGACIPTLYPLVKKVFGNSILSEDSQCEANEAMDSRSTVLTIGSYGRLQRIRARVTLSSRYTADISESGDSTLPEEPAPVYFQDATLGEGNGQPSVAQT